MGLTKTTTSGRWDWQQQQQVEEKNKLKKTNNHKYKDNDQVDCCKNLRRFSILMIEMKIEWWSEWRSNDEIAQTHNGH